ncbi:hypothetical protein, partial [Streptomyces adustus]
SPPSRPNPNRRSPHNRNRNSCRDYTTPRDMTQEAAAPTGVDEIVLSRSAHGLMHGEISFT